STPVPVPKLLATGPAGRALLFERTPGTDDLASVADDERQSVACDFGRCLGRLHRLVPADLDLGSLAPSAADGEDHTPTHADIGLWQSIRDSRCGVGATEVTEPALKW